jgi:hypothetical protein
MAVDHYGVLATIERALRLPLLGAAANAPTAAWRRCSKRYRTFSGPPCGRDRDAFAADRG